MFERFEKLIDPFVDDELKVAPTGFVAFCWYFVHPVWPILLMVSLLGATIAMVEVFIFTFLGDLVDWLATADKATFLEDNWLVLMGISVVLLVLRPALEVAWQLVFHQGLVGTFPMAVRWRVHRYLLRQSVSFYQNDFAGRIANKVMQTALGVREVVTKFADIFVYVSVYFTSAVVVVSAANLQLAAPFMLWLVAYGLTLRYFIPRLRDVSKQQADARSIMTGHVVDAYTNISTVKLFSHAKLEEAYVKKSMSAFLTTVFGQMRMITLLNICLVSLNMFLLFGVGALAVALWQVDAVSLGDIAIAISLVIRLQGMAHWVMWEMAGLFENVGTVQDGISTISREREVQDAPDAKVLSVETGEIAFDGVRFHYGKANGVIESLDLTIKPGEKIGLIGRSGAGKSTLVNLLLRFYDIEGGKIFIDGQDVSTVTQESLRANIGVVTQDTSLLHRSIYENVAYGLKGATREQVEEALKKAHALDFVRGLSDQEGRIGLDAQVGERGVKLSGGQRQRIAIARVLLKNAPILVLDEATSALDSEVEAAIQESLFDLMEGKTVIAIAHRLSTIAALDRLVVLDKGNVIETGRHEDLLHNGGLYAQLWSHQSGGFIDSKA